MYRQVQAAMLENARSRCRSGRRRLGIAPGKVERRDRRFGILRQPAPSGLGEGRARQGAARRTAVAQHLGSAAQLLDRTTRLPFRSTRGPTMSIVPEMPSCDDADTTLSGETRYSSAMIVMFPPCPWTA